MYPWLNDAIERDAVIITASRRLARELQAAYAAEQLAAGVLSWVTPSIHFWNDWCRLQLDVASDPINNIRVRSLSYNDFAGPGCY